MGKSAEHDLEGRVITTEFDEFHLVNVYVRGISTTRISELLLL